MDTSFNQESRSEPNQLVGPKLTEKADNQGSKFDPALYFIIQVLTPFMTPFSVDPNVLVEVKSKLLFQPLHLESIRPKYRLWPYSTGNRPKQGLQ